MTHKTQIQNTEESHLFLLVSMSSTGELRRERYLYQFPYQRKKMAWK